ncbi:unnamed protein product [Blepharisma stoltei]|uniref:Cyclin N-terminal domain-containing protein n=1 Tax=Blepharisma stoltei TaxID=1481888 RepID=A0AAU9K3N5_9CILI|nr:unnamed protein product [Blepharisma stoltei]
MSGNYPSELSKNTLLPISKQNKNPSDSDAESCKSSEFGGLFDQQLIEKYEEEHHEFMQYGLSQKSELILRRISMSKQVPYEFRIQPFFRLLVGAYQELNLNEIEVAVWAIYIERFVWPEPQATLHYLLVTTAFAAKLHMNDDTNHLKEYLKTKILGFEENFALWYSQNEKNMMISLQELNTVYSNLGEWMEKSKDNMAFELNYYVDDILKSSLPYQSEAKELQNDFKSGAKQINIEHIPVMPLQFPPVEVRQINFYDNLLPPLSNPNSGASPVLNLHPQVSEDTDFLNLTPNYSQKGKSSASF